MQVEHYQQAGFTVVRLWGAFSMHNVYPIKRVFQRLLEQGQRRFAVDLGEVTVLDSAAIGTLTQAYKDATNQRGELFIFGCPDQFEHVFTSASVDQMIKLYPTFEEGAAEASTSAEPD